MPLKLISEDLNGLMVFEPLVFKDERGYFLESFRSDDLKKYGVLNDFVQENESFSKKNVVRGLHFQFNPKQGKLIRVITGEAMFFEVDIRPDSPSFGKYAKFLLTSANKYLLWVPAGFANGFKTLSDNVTVNYKVTNYWNPQGEATLKFDDPVLGIDWDLDQMIVSEKDRNGKLLSELSVEINSFK